MNEEQEIRQYATSHYSHYPKGNFPIYLAYGFRPMFLLLAPYIILSIVLWTLSFSGYLPLPFIQDGLSWHIYEMLYGVGTAGLIAFFLTGAPELFPGTVPIVGRQLASIIGLWIIGRIGFWFMDYVGVYFVALTNIALIIWITLLVAKPVFTDIKKRHFSLAYMLIIILAIQIWFFASQAQWIQTTSFEILKVALGAFTVLELVALRRVNMEAINELLRDDGIDETFYARAPRYNLAIFCITLFTAVDFFYPNNSLLGYLGLASAAAILGILNDYRLKDYFILNRAFVLYMVAIYILMAAGYGFLGFDYLNDTIYALNHFRHFLTTGVFGLVFFMVMIIVSTVHTGRHLFTNTLTHIAVVCIVLSTLIRSFIGYYESYAMEAYMISTVLWVIPFIIYIKIFFPYLLQKRADGIPG
jgi:uncharacterized protein involved in response to NO